MAATSSALPFVDEHSIVVDAPVPQTWCATAAFMEAGLGRIGSRYAQLVGVRGERAFEVDAADPPYRIEFAGEHRYARYALLFTTEEIAPGRTRLTLRSSAEFPGAFGRLYKLAVIGTRFHVLAVRWMLRRIAKKAVEQRTK